MCRAKGQIDRQRSGRARSMSVCVRIHIDLYFFLEKDMIIS